MKLEWDADELYPVYSLQESKGDWPEHELEVPVDFFERYATAMREFWAVQMEIRKMVGEE